MRSQTTKRFNTNDSGIISRAVMMAIKEPREAQISHVHTLNICHGKMRTKNQPKQPFFGGGNPYLQDFQVKCPKFRCFLGELCEVASPKKKLVVWPCLIWCWRSRSIHYSSTHKLSMMDFPSIFEGPEKDLK